VEGDKFLIADTSQLKVRSKNSTADGVNEIQDIIDSNIAQIVLRISSLLFDSGDRSVNLTEDHY
jgi:hypothetical protein